jgi:hypothetical protein
MGRRMGVISNKYKELRRACMRFFDESGSVRELARWCHNTAQDQHSKANSIMLRSLDRRANAGAGVRSDCVNPSKTHRQAELSSRPGNLPRVVPSRPPVAVPGPESSGYRYYTQ